MVDSEGNIVSGVFSEKLQRECEVVENISYW